MSEEPTRIDLTVPLNIPDDHLHFMANIVQGDKQGVVSLVISEEDYDLAGDRKFETFFGDLITRATKALRESEGPHLPENGYALTFLVKLIDSQLNFVPSTERDGSKVIDNIISIKTS